jgi:hypothetical protein
MQGGESDMSHHLNGGVGLGANDGTWQRLHGVEGYHHAHLTHIQAMGHGPTTTENRCIPVVAETEECVV